MFLSKNNTYSKFEIVVTFIFVISPILQTYGWGKYDFAFILTSLVGLLSLLLLKIHLKELPKYLSFYLLYWFIIHLVSSSSFENAVSLGVVKTFLVFGAFFSIIKLPLLLRFYKLVVRICLIFFYLQIVVLALTGFNLLGVFSFLPLALDVDAATYFQQRVQSLRFSSFFSEPAFFAQYLLPYLSLLLFAEKVLTKNKIIEIVIVVFALLVTQSGNAILGLVVNMIFFLYYRITGSLANKVTAFLLFLGLIFGANYFSKTEIGQNLLDRQVQININSVDELGYSTSGFMRIFRGYYIFAEYSPLFKIIGNDNQLYKKNAANRSEMSSYFQGDDYMYYNTIQGFLLNTGLIGLIIMFLVYKKIWIITDRCGKCILITFIALNFISSAYFTHIMCLYLLFPTLMGRLQSNTKY